MQDVTERPHNASSQLDDLYQHLDSFIDELESDSLPVHPKVRMEGVVGVRYIMRNAGFNQPSYELFFFFFNTHIYGGYIGTSLS